MRPPCFPMPQRGRQSRKSSQAIVSPVLWSQTSMGHREKPHSVAPTVSQPPELIPRPVVKTQVCAYFQVSLIWFILHYFPLKRKLRLQKKYSSDQRLPCLAPPSAEKQLPSQTLIQASWMPTFLERLGLLGAQRIFFFTSHNMTFCICDG